MNLELDAHPHLKTELAGFSETPGRFEIRIEAVFESAHYLYEYFPDGRDEPMHGHTWKVEVFLARPDLGVGSDGIAYDFLRARKRLDELIERIEHICINDLAEFKGVNPTTENIARWFYAGLGPVVEADGALVREIRVFEGPSNMVSFRPENKNDPFPPNVE